MTKKTKGNGAKAAKKKTTTPKLRQRELTGFERERDGALEAAILDYIDKHDTRITATRAEVEAKKTLRELLEIKAEKAKQPLDKYAYKFVDGEVEHTAECAMPGEPSPKVKSRELTA